MTRTENAGPGTDPFETWRQLYDANERAWTAALEQAMGSDEFGETSGKMLETMLTAQGGARKHADLPRDHERADPRRHRPAR